MTIDAALARRAVSLLASVLLLGGAPAAAGWCSELPLVACRPLAVRAAHHTLRLAVARDEARRARGLMNVPVVAHGEGMLFAFPDGDQRRYFWMKDTIAPLDMVFVRANGVVTGVAADVRATLPGTPDDQVERRDGVGRYVIELGAGDAARLGIVPGVKLVVPAVSAR